MSSLDSTEVSDNVPASLGSIRPILHTAREIEHEHPCVAFLCRFYAFEKAHIWDPLSKGRGVTLFKESLPKLLTRTMSPVLLHGLKRPMYRKLTAYIGSTMISILAHLTREIRQIELNLEKGIKQQEFFLKFFVLRIRR